MLPGVSDEAVRKVLIKNITSGLYTRLRSGGGHTDVDRKRWIWELIQNAKDSIVGDSQRKCVDIFCEIESDSVRFVHDGSPFTEDAQLGLICKFSEGKDNKESTGQFGTGFMTTHCLSTVIDVKSDIVASDGNLTGFSMTIYRDGVSREDLKKGVEKTFESVRTIDPPGKTEFCYPLKSELNRRAGRLGAQSFYDNIIETMIFCPTINSAVLIYEKLPF